MQRHPHNQNKSLWMYTEILKLVVLHSIFPFYVNLISFLLGYSVDRLDTKERWERKANM